LLAGDSAVSFFFVLSGFILVVSAGRDTQLPAYVAKGRFWRNRVARIYPLYLVALLLTLASDVLTHNRTFRSVDAGSAISSALLIQAWLPGYAMDLNYPGWSLSAEVFFYALFPLLFARMIRQSTRRLLVLTGLAWAISLFVHQHMIERIDRGTTNDFHSLTMYFPVLHLNTFLVGITIGFVFMRHRLWLAQHQQLIGLTLLILLMAAGWVVWTQHPVLRLRHNGLAAPLFAVFILWLSVQSNGFSRRLSHPALVYLGEISYGIYLLQIPVGMLAFYANYHWLHLPIWLYVPTYLGLLCLVAAASYHWIEQPTRRLIRQWTLPRFVSPSNKRMSQSA
jgi:peptidoglycan/LPS O-acetylase OafA/YrhL